MEYKDVLKKIKEGKLARRPEWRAKGKIINETNLYLVTDYDKRAKDWIIVEPINE